MLKNIKYLAIMAGVALFCASCTDYLTSAPVDRLSPEGFYNSPVHIEDGVLGVYSLIRGIESDQYMVFSSDRSDEKYVNPVANGIRICVESSYIKMTYTTDEINGLWDKWYKIIFNTNTVLANIDNVKFDNESMKNQFKGELLFLRGWAHMELARTFGNVPIVDKVLSTEESKQHKQSDPASVMAAAINDLKEAENLLPYQDGLVNSKGDKIGACGRADKIATEAMIARAYMTLKGFPFNDSSAKANAKTYLEKVLNYSKSNGNKYWAPTFEEWARMYLTDNSYANKYQIFSIQHTRTAGNPYTGSEGTIFGGKDKPDETGVPYLPYGGGGALASEAWVDVSMIHEYSKENDPRGEGFSYINMFYAWGTTTNDHVNIKLKCNYDGKEIEEYEKSIPVKWSAYQIKRDKYGITGYDDATMGTSWPVNVPIIRLEDMQLYYAELLVEDGNIAEAMGYVNGIRNRAGITPVPTDCSATDALNYVKRERRLELFLEGTRWFDMVRYGEWKQITLDKYARHNINGKPAEGIAPENVIDGRHFLPIPFAQMAAVPGLYQQNEGWK